MMDLEKTKIFVKININSDKNKHSLFFVTAKEKYNLINTSKDWVKNFNLYKDNKKMHFKNAKYDLNKKNKIYEDIRKSNFNKDNYEIFEITIFQNEDKNLLKKQLLTAEKNIIELLDLDDKEQQLLNCEHSGFLNIIKKEANRKKMKPINVYDLQMNLLYAFESISDCSRKLNINGSNIYNVLNNIQKTSKGYIFKFVN
jgi:hypothetical protein